MEAFRKRYRSIKSNGVNGVPVKWETEQKWNTAKQKETQRNETKHDETKENL